MQTRKRFNIVTPGTNSVVIGPCFEDNAYLRAYPKLHAGCKPVAQLAIGESSRATYNLSGSTGVYDIVRIEDES